VKENALLVCPPDVTTTLPVTAPTGTVAMIAVLVQLVVDAVKFPWNLTVPELPKLVPVIVIDSPMPPGFGEIEVMLGVCA